MIWIFRTLTAIPKGLSVNLVSKYLTAFKNQHTNNQSPSHLHKIYNKSKEKAKDHAPEIKKLAIKPKIKKILIMKPMVTITNKRVTQTIQLIMIMRMTVVTALQYFIVACQLCQCIVECYICYRFLIKLFSKY